MKKIATVYDLFYFILGKNVATKQPPERIDAAFYEVIIGTFNEHYDHYVKTQKISDFLSPLKRKKVLAFVAGVAALPDGYAHARSMTLADGSPVDPVEDKFWAYRCTRKVGPVSLKRPIYRIEDTGAEPEVAKIIEILPNTIAASDFYFFRNPTPPKYAYTVVSNRYVYDDAGSTDMDFPVGMIPMLVMRLLSRFGMNLREQQVVNYAEQMKQMESTK